MSSHMDFESTASHELITTTLTNVRSFTRMSSLVISQVALSREGHITICKVTPKRFLTVVDPHMGE